MAGYSGTPLAKKLGVKADMLMFVDQPPPKYFDWISPLPQNVNLKQRLSGPLDFIHIFVKNAVEFEKRFIASARHLKKDGMLWVSWPKKTSGLATDLDENKIRDFGLNAGLVDVKVCAVDETWSALKFVYRIKDR